MAAAAPKTTHINNKTLFIKYGKILYESAFKSKGVLCKRIETFKDFKNLGIVPAGCGGTIGYIPYYITDNNIIFLLTNSKWTNTRNKISDTVTGCIGGGITHGENPFDGLIKKLQEEVPSYKDSILTSLENNPLEIISIEKPPPNPKHARFFTIIIFQEIPLEFAIEMNEHIKAEPNSKQKKQLLNIVFASALPSDNYTLNDILHPEEYKELHPEDKNINLNISSGLKEYRNFADMLFKLNSRKVTCVPPSLQKLLQAIQKKSKDKNHSTISMASMASMAPMVPMAPMAPMASMAPNLPRSPTKSPKLNKNGGSSKRYTRKK